MRLLAEHPWFELAELAASVRSAGKKYGEAARWLTGALDPQVARMPVLACDPKSVRSPIVFSALDAAAATDAEAAFARAGRFVLSNARSYRMEPDVPLLIPEVNAEHLALVEAQRKLRKWEGAIATNPNCAATVVAMALAPLHAAFGVRQCFVTTLQAVSGAGYPGVASLDILGNAIPFIGGGEEEKIETETPKMLGTYSAGSITPAPIAMSAQVTRVPVEHGHTVCLSIALDKRVTPDAAIAALEKWKGSIHGLGLPSAPERPIVVTRDEARPQPRRDVDAGGGMTVTVGRVRTDPLLDLRLVALGHNIVRGAAGASILNAELAVHRKVVLA